MQRVGLHQQPTELHAIEELPQSLDLAATVWGSPGTVDSDQRPVTVSLWATVNCCS